MENTILSGDMAGTVVHFEKVDDAVISGFTIKHGVNEDGGGIYCDSSRVLIKHCKIEDNQAHAGAGGGGIYATNFSEVHIFRSKVSNNSTTGNGGGIAVSDSTKILIEQSEISDNYSDEGGGGIWSYGSTSFFLNTSLVSGNSSDEIGGGIAIFSTSGDSSYINGSTIVENESKSIEGDEPPSGSAIYTDWNIQMHHSIVWDNKTNFYDPRIYFNTQH